MEENNFNKSLTVIIPGLNEEKNIVAAVNSIKSGLLKNNINDYEIFIVNDGSTDRTGSLAEDLARADSRIKVIHHKIPQGFGSSYLEGVSLASKEYVIIFPGDNEVEDESAAVIMSNINKSDVVVVYTENKEVRALVRRLFSKTYTFINNFLFGLRLPYFNGACLIKRELLQNLKIKDDKFVFMTEILVKLIKRDGRSYITAPMRIKPIAQGTSKAFKLKNFVGVGKGILNLFKEIYF
ncbi:MAG: glycosyltransferase family 2 protein [Parcubacteria group bacterium]|nr:glycosyltransferase family 2 protein [Parcubacteria group bacterium]